MQEVCRACMVLERFVKGNLKSQDELKIIDFLLIGDYNNFLDHYIMNESSCDKVLDCSKYLGQ